MEKENKELYDMGFKAGVKAKPPKHVKENLINLKVNYQDKVLIEKLTKLLIVNNCPIPEFFYTADKKELGRKMTIYLMGLQNGSLL